MPPKKKSKKDSKKETDKVSKSKKTSASKDKKTSASKTKKTSASKTKKIKVELEELSTDQSTEDNFNDEPEEKEIDSNIYSEDISINSNSEVKDCELEDTLEDDYFDDNNNTENENNQDTIFLTGNDRRTNPRLTKYEMVRLLGERIKQLTMGAKPLVKNVQDLSYDQIAMEELKLNMIPFKIKRPLPNKKIEIWSISELNKKHLDSLLN